MGEMAGANPRPTFVPTAQLLPLLYARPQLTCGGLLTSFWSQPKRHLLRAPQCPPSWLKDAPPSSPALPIILHYYLLSKLHYVMALSGFPLFIALCVGAPRPTTSPARDLSLVLDTWTRIEYPCNFLFGCFVRILLLEQVRLF